MLGMKHFILSVWGLRKLRKLWNHEWRLFFSLLMKAKPLVLLEPQAFLSVPFPSSLLPHRETFYQRLPSVCLEAATSLIAWAPSNPFSCSPCRVSPQPDFSLLLFADHIERVIPLKGGELEFKIKILNSGCLLIGWWWDPLSYINNMLAFQWLDTAFFCTFKAWQRFVVFSSFSRVA